MSLTGSTRVQPRAQSRRQPSEQVEGSPRVGGRDAEPAATRERRGGPHVRGRRNEATGEKDESAARPLGADKVLNSRPEIPLRNGGARRCPVVGKTKRMAEVAAGGEELQSGGKAAFGLQLPGEQCGAPR